MKEYNKLVRDKIPEIIEKSGKKAITRTLTDEEFKEYLEKKLDEEVAEFHKEKSLEELIDVLEVISAICTASGYSTANVNLNAAYKRNKRGGFERKILLIAVEEGEVENGKD